MSMALNRFVSLIIPALLLAATGAIAETLQDPLTPLLGSKTSSLCFTRQYSPDHLKQHPKQATEAAMLSFKADAVRFMLRQKGVAKPAYSVAGCGWREGAGYDTSDRLMIPGFKKKAGFDCIVTVSSASAEEGGYALIDPAPDAKSLILYVQSGVTARRGLDKSAKPFDLTLGSEDQAFQLTRTDPGACKAMEDAIEGP